MKRRKPATRKPALPAKDPTPKLPGRYCKMWLSAEFVTWCKKHHFKPEGFGRCVLHTFAKANPGGHVIVRSEGGPVHVDEIYDLPGDGKESD